MKQLTARSRGVSCMRQDEDVDVDVDVGAGGFELATE